MDISPKLDRERENIKQLFTLVLQKAGTLTIAANQITKILRDVIKDTAVTKIRILSKDVLLRLVTQKVHVHGLVLHDVIAMLEDDIAEENINYLKEYFEKLFLVFNKKILHVLDGCSDIRLHEMMRQKFDTAVRKIRYLEELQASNEASLIEVICKCQFIRSLGVGIADFEGIEMPKFNKYDVSKLAANTDDLTKDDKERIEKETKKRMEDENEIIEQVQEFITETDQKHFELTLYQQAKIKESVITDVKNHLFKCLETWP